MKLTMVIADDEALSLKSMEMLIRKEFHNIELVGLAENGIELKEMLETLQPDLAVVDIRMPGLTGLEVMSLLKKKGCGTRFIVNTAYSDFAYVKEALDLKTDGYLLKPVKREECVETIAGMCKSVEEEKLTLEKHREMQQILHTVTPVLESEILLSVLFGKALEEDFRSYCALNGIAFEMGCVLTFISKSRYTETDNRRLNAQLSRIMQGICSFLSTISDQSIVVMLILPPEIKKDQSKVWCGEMAQLIADELGKTTGMEFLYGVGGACEQFLQMKDSYQESLRGLATQKNKNELLGESMDKIDNYVEYARAYIEKHFTQDISLNDCAEQVGISPFYLSHIFKEKTEKTFVEYLAFLRIEEAKRLCLESDCSIREIAERCGYRNLTYFYKVFKRATGRAVGEYRKEKQDVGSK